MHRKPRSLPRRSGRRGICACSPGRRTSIWRSSRPPAPRRSRRRSPGADYCQRIAVVTKSLRLTLLLEEKLAGRRDERRKAAAKREAAQEDWHDLRVKLAMLAAAYEVSEDEAEVDRRVAELCERVERPEVAELIEVSRPEVAVAALCRRWGFPPDVERWLEMADEAMEHYGFIPPQDGEDDEDDPEDPPEPRSAAPGRREPPDTG